MVSEEGSKRGRSSRGRGRGRGRARGRGRGRGRKASKVISSDEESIEEQSPSEQITQDAPTVVSEPDPQEQQEVENNENVAPKIDLEADISQLEAPTFTTIQRGPPEPMLRLQWDHKVSLQGEKVLNPMIHTCDQCNKPILIYGRMIPCKHIFCLKCAKAEPKTCPRCHDKVCRVEQTGLGTVFMCTYGGTRYGNTGCRRTYLSQRDLQAHINHRHINSSVSVTHSAQETTNIHIKLPAPIEAKPPQILRKSDTRVHPSNINPASQTENRQRNSYPMISSAPMRTNLITVPIQDTNAPTNVNTTNLNETQGTNYSVQHFNPVSNYSNTYNNLPPPNIAPIASMQNIPPIINTLPHIPPMHSMSVPPPHISTQPPYYGTYNQYSQPPNANQQYTQPPPPTNQTRSYDQTYIAPQASHNWSQNQYYR